MIVRQVIGHHSYAPLPGIAVCVVWLSQNVEHVWENVFGADDENDVLDEFHHSAPEQRELVLVVQNTVTVRLHLTVSAKIGSGKNQIVTHVTRVLAYDAKGPRRRALESDEKIYLKIYAH